jgi:hypothetical protein
VAAALAQEQLQGRLRIAPWLVATSSEVLTADMRRRIVEAFGLEPLDFYGTTEAWTSWRTWSWSRWSTSTAGPSRRAPTATRCG